MNETTKHLNITGNGQMPQHCNLKDITNMVQQINCLDIKQISKVCIEHLPKLINARYASLYLLDEISDMLHLEKHNHPFLINNIVSLNQANISPMIKAVRCKNLMVINNINTHRAPSIDLDERKFSKNYESNACIIAPLICQNMVLGVLNFAEKIDNSIFTDEDVSMVELFRQLVSSSIGNIKLFEKTQFQAKTDGLTNLINHRTFYETLETELMRCRRYGGQISVIMIDIDNLKPINDTYGHRAGDMVIKRVSRKIITCIRNIDVAARYGGDEFAVILPNTSIEDATVVAKRMVEEVSNTPIVWERQKINLSVSVGVGQYDGNFTPEDAAKFSDQALYSAKQAGKNNVKVFSEIGVA